MKSLFQKFQPAILVLALMLFGQNSSIAQVICKLKFVATPSPSNPGIINFQALPGDSISYQCFGPNSTYNWSFGDGTSGTGQNVSHTYSGTGYRYVCVSSPGNAIGTPASFCDTITIDSIVPPNCFVVFSFGPALITLPLSFQFNPDVSNVNCFPPNTVYRWTWGDGTSEISNGPGNSTIKTYANAGNYWVCFSATAPGMSPVSSCQTVNANYAGGNFNVSGMVQANNACLNSPVLVELISLTDSEQRAMVLNSPNTDSCFYWFNVPAVPVRNWVVRATPLQTNTFMPTYYGDVIFYNDATIFSTNAQQGQYASINLVPNFWGDSINWDSTSNPFFGRVSGTIAGNGTTIVSTLGNYNLSTIFNASQAVVIILNAQNKPIGFAKVNADGTFTTPNLPPGQYSLRVEAPKVPSQSVPFTITAGSNVQINFNATGSGINTVTSVNKTIKSSELSIYPNPANDKISLKGVSGSVKIIDTKGQTVLETASTSNIEIAKLPSGLYTITGLNKANKVISARFVKN